MRGVLKSVIRAIELTVNGIWIALLISYFMSPVEHIPKWWIIVICVLSLAIVVLVEALYSTRVGAMVVNRSYEKLTKENAALVDENAALVDENAHISENRKALKGKVEKLKARVGELERADLQYQMLYISGLSTKHREDFIAEKMRSIK